MKRILLFLHISFLPIIIAAMESESLSLDAYQEKNKNIEIETIYLKSYEFNKLDLSNKNLDNIDSIADLEVSFKGYMMYLSQVPRLILNLSHNHIVHLPSTISCLQLIRLDLSYNALKELPGELTQLKRLKVLDLFKNNIDALPDNIGDLTKLRSLDASDNNIQSLPDSMSKLSSLQSLNIAFNKLTVMPQFFPELKKLHTLTFYGNSFDTPLLIGNLKYNVQKGVYSKSSSFLITTSANVFDYTVPRGECFSITPDECLMPKQHN